MITDFNHRKIFFALHALHCLIETFNFVILNLGLCGFEIAAFIPAWQISTNFPNLFGNNIPDGLILILNFANWTNLNSKTWFAVATDQMTIGTLVDRFGFWHFKADWTIQG
jgi:hypothetical protein